MFSEPFLYGFNGIDATSLNRMVEAGRFVFANQAKLTELVNGGRDFRLNWLLMKVTASSAMAGASNRWVYTLQAVVPQDQLAGVTAPTGSTFDSATGYNIAEFGNTSSTAGGVNATRAAGLGFSMIPVPTGTLVHAFQLTHTTGLQILLFERANAWDGECPAPGSLVDYIDGGIYGVS